MRSPFVAFSLGLLWLVPASIAHATQVPEPPDLGEPGRLSDSVEVAQWTQEQEDRFEAQREAERQQAADRIENMRNQMRDYQQQWQTDSREWRSRQEDQNEHLQERYEEDYGQYYGDSEARYIDGHLYRSYGDRNSGDDWTFRLYYSDDDLGVSFGSPYREYDHPYPYLYYQDEYYYDQDVYLYEPRVIDRVYAPYPVVTFGNNSFVHLDLVSTASSGASVVLVGSNGSQQLSFDALNQEQSVYLPAGTYQITFVDAASDRTWLSGYLDLGFSPVVRIEFDPLSQTANLYGDPQAWRAE